MFQAGCGTEKYLKQHFSRRTQILWYNLVARTHLVLSILIVSNMYMTKTEKTFTFNDEQWLISLIIDSFSQKQTCHLHQLCYREIALDILSHSSNQRLCTLFEALGSLREKQGKTRRQNILLAQAFHKRHIVCCWLLAVLCRRWICCTYINHVILPWSINWIAGANWLLIIWFYHRKSMYCFLWMISWIVVWIAI